MQEMRETQVRPLEKEMATHFSILAWENHGQKSLAGCSPRGRKELDMTEHACTQLHLSTRLSTRSHRLKKAHCEPKCPKGAEIHSLGSPVP